MRFMTGALISAPATGALSMHAGDIHFFRPGCKPDNNGGDGKYARDGHKDLVCRHHNALPLQ